MVMGFFTIKDRKKRGINRNRNRECMIDVIFL